MGATFHGVQMARTQQVNEQNNLRAVIRTMFHGREYDEAVSRLALWMRKLTADQRAAFFGVLCDEWCIQCRHEHPHCKCPTR
jgi:hypothetical protein